MADALRDYCIQIRFPLRWGEMDAYEHLNNTVYFRYFEDVRIKYFEAIGLNKIKVDLGISGILASTQCRYRIPLTYPGEVIVGARTKELKVDRFLMEYAVFSVEHDKIAASGDGLVVGFDYSKGNKAELPGVLVAAIRELEGERLTTAE